MKMIVGAYLDLKDLNHDPNWVKVPGLYCEKIKDAIDEIQRSFPSLDVYQKYKDDQLDFIYEEI